MKKHLILLLSGLALLLFIAGCGQKEGSDKGGATQEAEKTMEEPMDTTMMEDSTMQMDDSTMMEETGDMDEESHEGGH